MATALFDRGQAWLDVAAKQFRADNPTWSNAECRHYLVCDMLAEIRHRQYLADLPDDHQPLYYFPGPTKLHLTSEQRLELDMTLVEWEAYTANLATTIQAEMLQRLEVA